MHSIRALAIVGLVAVSLGACTGETGDTTSTSTTAATTTTTTLPPDPAVDGPVLRVGLTESLTSVNWWEVLDNRGSPANLAVVSNTKESLFTLTKPGFVMVPALAEGDPAPARQQGETWIVEQSIRNDVFWSDGEQVTAADLVFYFDVVREFGLGSAHATNFPASVVEVSALDDLTVRVEFNTQPSITDWQAGVGMAPFVPSHYWAPHVEEAREAGEGARERLYAVDPTGEPSAGTLIFESWEPGDGAVTRSNPEYRGRGTETTVYSDGSVRLARPSGEDVVYGGEASGSVEAHHVIGPFVSAVHWDEFASEVEAYDALEGGLVDFVFHPDGMSLPTYNRLAGSGGIGISTSVAEGFRFLGFNLRKPPMSDPVFREAVATVIDKELVASSLFAGSLNPAYTVVHPGLSPFYEPEVERPGWSNGAPMAEGERFESAVTMLTEAGYTWDVAPEVVYGEDGSFVDVVPGAGLEMPNGVDVPELTILAAPSAGEDLLRATLALWIAEWMTDLGIDVVAELTDLDSVVEVAIAPDTPEASLSWDLKVLGWGRAEPSLPGLTLVALFHSRNGIDVGGLNTTGYSSADFDAAADAFTSSTSIADAARWTREMERIIADDLPYLVLYRSSVIEAFGSAVQFPVDSVTGGHASTGRAWPEAVRVTR
ncbi:MAG TPA: ABC transporter substrate-binding protein [Acidimicrobiia bacterium]|nr:ABC transporter substrate-binding protein [Acidimicrobiia bacterium]